MFYVHPKFMEPDPEVIAVETMLNILIIPKE